MASSSCQTTYRCTASLRTGPGTNSPPSGTPSPGWESLSSSLPSYSSLATQNGAPVDALVAQLRLIDGWMERYPDVPLVLTHGLSWRMFIDGDGLDIPDAVYDAVPDSPRFYMQLLFAIFLGGVWDYPMNEVRPTMEKLVERVGVERLMWGTDIPMVLRFYTYRQNLEHIRICSDFLLDDQVDLIVGGNMARLMGVSQG